MEREPLLNGQIDMLLLSVLARGAAHGYAIMEQLKQKSRGGFDLPEGTVYPALYRLERKGLLKSRAEKVSGRTRRIYSLTPAGREALRERRESWKKLVSDIAAVLTEGPALGGA
jgi:PadR family transcriptional regulator, regulatory protein PadR